MPISFDGTTVVPEYLPRMACGGTPQWDDGSGYSYRCMDCGAVIGSIGQSKECADINAAAQVTERLKQVTFK